MTKNSEYYWIRIYDYLYERDSFEKGTLLDEFYLKDIIGGREAVKQTVLERYALTSTNNLKFAKPRKQGNGTYALIMDSNKSFYDRFYLTIDTYCFCCHSPIKGKMTEFPRAYIGDDFNSSWQHQEDYEDLTKTGYFCKHECKRKFENIRNDVEGEFQQKEEGKNGDVFGYIYLIYNRLENIYYVGQTRYMPFFRWQEHIKEGQKGSITDLNFSVLTEINKNKNISESENQIYLNNIEAWWIKKYEQEGYKVFNITKPKITLQELKERFNEMVLKQTQLILNI